MAVSINGTTGIKQGGITGATVMPVGTTEQRPSTPESGMFRFNSATGFVEYYDVNGALWVTINETPQIYNFIGTITFTNCDQSGPFGPVLSNALSAYTAEPFQSTWLNDVNLFNVIAGVQYWRVPKTGTYTIRTAGARSGTSTYGGLGRDLTSSFNLVAGEWLKIVCGQLGQSNGTNYAGGGGASFVAVSRGGFWIPLLVAGGGAGISPNSPQSTNTNRNGWSPGTRVNETRGGAGSWYNTSYGSQIGSNWCGGGGGGWSADGGDGQINIYVSGQPLGGRSLSSTSPMGGVFTHDLANTWDGGFGGGGATGTGSGAAGGGGGWWGGNSTYTLLGAVADDTTHLGGGSYSANNTLTDNGTRNGAGFVSVTLG